MKIRAAALLVLAAIVVATVYRLPGDIDRVVTDGIAFYGTVMTKAKVSATEVHIASASGKGTISNLRIGNPAGFKTTHALMVDRIDVDIDIASIAQDVVIVRLIIVNAPDVMYEKGEAMTNFDALHRNIANYLDKTGAMNRMQGKKLIVEELTICNSRAQASAHFMDGKAISVPLHDMTLKNLGTARGGITPGELGQEVVDALKAKLTRSVNFDRMKESTGEDLDKAGVPVNRLIK